jgi:serine/threonine protein phosphatase 1
VAEAARAILYCLLVWAPIPLGSNRPIFWVVNGVAATVALALFVAGEIVRDQKVHFNWRPVAFLGAGLAVWALWIVLQALPGVPSALQHPLWTELADALPGISGAVSINPSATWTTAAQVVPIAFLTIIAIRLANDPNRAQFVLRLIVFATVGVALYGLIARYVGFPQVFVVAAPDNSFLTGTFVSRNAAATYLVIGLATATSLFLTQVETHIRKVSSGSGQVLSVVDALRSASGSLLACLVLAVALLNTGSRGGVIAGIVAVLCATLFWAINSPLSRKALAVVAVFVASAVFAVALLSSGVLMQRLWSGMDTQGRLEAFQDTIDMILARPILGHGAGTFIDAFPLYHNFAPSYGVWNAAHNSYLQVAAELGIPVASILFGAALAALVFLVLRFWRRTDPAPATLAAVSAAFAVGFHASVDFSLQFQAVGLTFAVLVGVGLGESLTLRERETAASGGLPRGPLTRPQVSIGKRETVLVAIPMSAPAVARNQSDAPPARVVSGPSMADSELWRVPGSARRKAGATADRVSGAQVAGLAEVLELDRPLESLEFVEWAKIDIDTSVIAGRGGAEVASEPPPAAIEPKTTYVFGDLHGRLDLLLRLKDAITRDRANGVAGPCLVIGIGDYIDRGVDSKGVLDALAGDVFKCPTILLRGNHEQMLLDFLDKPIRAGRLWFRHGAIETLRSYGVDVTGLVGSAPRRYTALRDSLVRLMPPGHIVLLRKTLLSHEVGEFFFTHAGVRPGTALARQQGKDLLWIKKGFSDRDDRFEKVIVHGHTAVEKPYFGEYRINLDTGAYLSNLLTCLVIEGSERRLLEV